MNLITVMSHSTESSNNTIIVLHEIYELLLEREYSYEDIGRQQNLLEETGL